MTYAQTLDWMFAQLPMYQKIGAAAHTKDLKNTIILMEHLNHPELKFKSIHVGGTNGKGSSSSLLASVLQEAGYKVGLYTSPHLKDFRERIKINGEMIPQENVTAFIATHKTFLENNHLSFFEMTVGLAFDFFANQIQLFKLLGLLMTHIFEIVDISFFALFGAIAIQKIVNRITQNFSFFIDFFFF